MYCAKISILSIADVFNNLYASDPVSWCGPTDDRSINAGVDLLTPCCIPGLKSKMIKKQFNQQKILIILVDTMIK